MNCISAEAVRLALAARARALMDRPTPTVLSDEALTRQMLEAAAPAIIAEAAAAERLKILQALDRADEWAEVQATLERLRHPEGTP